MHKVLSLVEYLPGFAVGGQIVNSGYSATLAAMPNMEPLSSTDLKVVKAVVGGCLVAGNLMGVYQAAVRFGVMPVLNCLIFSGIRAIPDPQTQLLVGALSTGGIAALHSGEMADSLTVAAIFMLAVMSQGWVTAQLDQRRSFLGGILGMARPFIDLFSFLMFLKFYETIGSVLSDRWC